LNKGISFFLRRLFFCSLSGFILSLAFPPFGFSQVAFIGFIPMLASARENRGDNFFFGIFTGLIFYSFSFFWLYKLAGFIYLLLALYLSIYWGIFLYTLYKLPPKGRIFLGAFIWFFLEIIVSNLITGFPWLLLGLSQWQEFFLLKTARLCGIYGISFLVILANLTFVNIFKKKYFYSSVVAILIFVAIFLITPEKFYKAKPVGEINVMVVQPNIISENNVEPEQVLYLLKEMTLSNLEKEGATLVVWPEGSFSDVLEKYPALVNDIKLLCNKYSLYILMGAFSTDDTNIYNSALLFGEDELQVYNKNHLAPYGEFILGGRYSFVRNVFEKVAGYTPYITPGNELKLFSLNGHKIAPLVCFENIFPDMTRELNIKGAQVFLVITNDSWFGKSAGPYQHFAHNVMRATESGKYFIQASLTGVSGVISPEGKIVETIESDGKRIFVPGTLSFKAPLKEGKTFYSRFGEVPLFLVGIFFIGMILCRTTKN